MLLDFYILISIFFHSFNKLLLQKEELEQKHVHLLQVVESEKTAKWQYSQHCEELASEIKKLRSEIYTLRKEYRPSVSVSVTPVGRGSFSAGCDINYEENSSLTGLCAQVQDSVELRKIKKVRNILLLDIYKKVCLIFSYQNFDYFVLFI